MAVHSMKDVGSYLPAGLKIESVLERGDPRDAFIGSTARTLDELPQGARIGTSSLRRQAQILARRLDVRIVPMRGNLETRLEKLKAGQADAIILAMAGLTRLGLGHVATSVLEPEIMLPAAAQGAIGIEIREDDYETQKIVQTINVPETALCVQAERALLRVLDGSCHTPIGSYARVVSPSVLKLEGLAAYPDGTSLIKLDSKGALADAEQIGEQLGMRMKDMLPVNFFAA
jgi:hydroxymethylbilane synthase